MRVTMLPELELTDWRRRIFELYAEVRSANDATAAWQHWRDVRDDLFRTHAQSPLPTDRRTSFSGLHYFEYDPAWRVIATVRGVEPVHYDIATSGDGSFGFTRFASASFDRSGATHSLELYWLDGYGDGLFVPFRDLTSGTTTYGAGRYLLDTAKGADLGVDQGGLILDFNFAYNPSCAYDPRWVCPLAPPPNRVGIEIPAGERIESNRE
jgi:uncharacterized protein (DUF1684 family)